MNYSQLAQALLPEASLTLGALLVLAADLLWFRRSSPTARTGAALGLAAVAVLSALWLTASNGTATTLLTGGLSQDTFAVTARGATLVLALIVLGITTAAPSPSHPAEHVALLLFSTAGILLMCAAENLLVAFLALELTSLPLYALVALDAGRRDSAEAALKYFLYGGVSAAFLLFGFSLLYGLTSAIDLPDVPRALGQQESSPLLSLALVMVLVALGYKVAAAPFHYWAPDAYQGAPAPVVALIASGSKLGGLVMFSRILWPNLVTGAGEIGSGRAGPVWLPTVALLAGASLLLGNLAALAQTNLRRLLAYSAIAHAGALLLGVMVIGQAGPGALVYYAATYGLATAGAFGVVAALERQGEDQRITDLAGLSRRSPLLAVCLLVFILSLAGIPPLAGFFGKFFVFAAALKDGGVTSTQGSLALAAILLSVVSLYYYLVILKHAWVSRPAHDVSALPLPFVSKLTLLTAAAALIALGLFPDWLLTAV